MSLPEQLLRLQQIDLAIHKMQQELDDIAYRLSDNESLLAAESRLASQREQLEDARKKQKALEWEVDDLHEKARRTDSKLYGGGTKNPKELVNLEKEIRSLRSQISNKEDALLGLIDQGEEMEAKARASAEEFGRLNAEWLERQETLGKRKGEVETALVELRENRDRLAKQIDSGAISLYERTSRTRDQAVVKVQRGRCQGCHITVPTSQWQKAKAGNIVQCSSCSRILSVE